VDLMEDDLVLTDPWWDLRGGGPAEEKQRKAIQTELIVASGQGTDRRVREPVHHAPLFS
jgi:hypothetical protein